MVLPSKELLSEIYNEFKIEDGVIYESVLDDCGYRWEAVNQYELMNLMKRWAYGYGFEIVERCSDAKVINGELEVLHLVEMYDEDIFSPSRVFSCCEWILKQKLQP